MYPNAANGVKKIFIAEILTLVSVVLGIAARVVDMILTNATGVDEGTNVVVTILGVGMGVIALFSFFLSIVGVNEASRDESAFKYASFAIIAAIILTLANGFFNINNNDLVRDIIQIVSDLASMIVTLFIIVGIRNLAMSLHDAKMEKKGGTLLNIVFIFSAIVILIRCSALFIKSDTTVIVIILSLCMIVAAILAVIKYILYLSYLAKANKMLADQV